MKSKPWKIGVVLFALSCAVGCATAQKEYRGLSVGDDGTLFRDGKVYRAIGVNYFDAFLRTLDDPTTVSYRDGFAYLAEKEIPLVRFAACGFWPVQLQQYIDDKESYFQRLDDVIATAEKHNIALIPSLFWYHAAVPDLVGEPVNAWGNPDSKTIAFMRQYATDVITRYIDSPAIIAWEFGNEFLHHADLPNAADHRPMIAPELGTPETRGSDDDYSFADTLVAYAEFAKVAKALDPKRPLSTGDAIQRRSAYHNRTEKSWTTDRQEEFEKQLLDSFSAAYSLASMHVYPETREARFGEAEPMKITRLFGLYKKVASKGNMALFVGEFGVGYPRTIPNAEQRIKTFTNTVDALVANEVPLATFWVFDYLNPDNNIVHRNAKVGNEKEWIIGYLAEANKKLNAKIKD